MASKVRLCARFPRYGRLSSGPRRVDLRTLAIVLILAPPATPQAARDITADILANRDITLTGDAVTNLTGAVTYTGVISGAGTLTVGGSGTLALAKDSDFTLPKDRQRQHVVTYNGNHPLTRVDNPDPPAVIVRHGATLDYQGGVIGHFQNVPGLAWNTLNIQVDGTLDVDVKRSVHLGIISGAGLISQPSSTYTSLILAGRHPFAGTIVVGSGFDYGSNAFVTELPDVHTIVDLGSAIHGAADGVTTVSPANYYSKGWGNDINYHTWGSGVVRNTGVYSWSDNASTSTPTLSDPSLNYADLLPHHQNKRGVNLEGATVEWGDGTTNRFFLPGDENTVYVNLHNDGRDRSRLTLNYNGPVTLAAPLSGGKYHDTLAAPGQGDVVIAATKGNAVTFTAPQNYDGSTTIGAGASLRLGDGTPGGDSGLLNSTRAEVVDDGTLVTQNAAHTLTLTRISGSGGLTQSGPATTILSGQTSYRGPTVVRGGTLVLAGGGSLATSSGVSLTAAGATLDLTKAGAQTLHELSGVPAVAVRLAAALTVGDSASTTFAGTVSGAPVTKVGTGTLTIAGTGTQWTVHEGTLATQGTKADVTVDKGAALRGAGTIDGSVTNAGTVTATGLALTGSYSQAPGGHLDTGGLAVTGKVTLAGTVTVTPGTTTVIDNKGTAPVTGTFDGLPEGATLDGGTLTYKGGDGNDVVLVGAHWAAGPAHHAGHGPVARWPWEAGSAAVAVALAAFGGFFLARRRRKVGSLSG